MSFMSYVLLVSLTLHHQHTKAIKKNIQTSGHPCCNHRPSNDASQRHPPPAAPPPQLIKQSNSHSPPHTICQQWLLFLHHYDSNSNISQPGLPPTTNHSNNSSKATRPPPPTPTPPIQHGTINTAPRPHQEEHILILDAITSNAFSQHQHPAPPKW